MFSLNALRPVTNIPPRKHFVFEPENDTIGSILGGICEVIEATNAFEFKLVVGTKAVRLPISVELEIYLEQLPNVLQAVRNEKVNEFMFDFYEQGVEMRLIFRKDADNVHLSWEDRRRFVRSGAESPEVNSQTLDLRGLESNLLSVATTFLGFTDEFCAGIANLPDFLNWRLRLYQQTSLR
jgi:hypothetical protein